MRILHLGKYYAPHKGGMETALRNITEGLLAAGHEVRVIVAACRNQTSREDLPGAPGALIRASSLGTCNSQPITIGLSGLIKRDITSFRPHIVHLHLPNPLACLAWRLATIRPFSSGDHDPLLAIWHHADIVRQRLGGRVVAPMIRWSLRTAAGICVSSEAWRVSSTQLTPWRDKVRVIPFGIDLDPFLAQDSGHDGPFLFVGRLVSYKGLDELLDAVAGLPEARLDIVGSGPLEHHLSRRCMEPALRHRIRMLGEVPDGELPLIMGRSRALVLPSRDMSETFGIVLIEAMAAGLPLVTSDLPTGVREINRDGETGLLVPPGDAARLKDALAVLMTDPDRSRIMGREGRQRAMQKYGRSRLATDLTLWYKELLQRSSSPEYP